MSLGKWTVIDIETTGIHPGSDDIIDIGFLQFEGTTLIKTFSSLVHSEQILSPFIVKLTGINQEMVLKAPAARKVFPELYELSNHTCLAHNAGFEESFLSPVFQSNEQRTEVRYADSMWYLSLLFPERSHLSLENFIQSFEIAQKEEHRGLADSRDLLKVMLYATYSTHQDKKRDFKLKAVFDTFAEDFWFKHFYFLSDSDLIHIAEQIDFNLTIKQSSKVETAMVDNGDYPSRVFSKENLENFYKDEKYQKKINPFYQFRKNQLEMTLKVGQSFKNKIHALIQAPTGTGKTMGYLVPATFWSLNEKKKVLIATGTKALQEQMMTKDIPELKATLGLNDFKIVRLIGSQNHLCELIFRQQLEENSLLTKINEQEQLANSYLEMFFFFNETHENHQKLTREDIPYVLKKTNDFLREKEMSLGVDFRTCVGPKCPLAASCSYMQGLIEAKKADMIIGNHALMLRWPKSLEKPESIIVDEAHRIESEATQHFSLEISEQTFDSLLKIWSNGYGALYYLLSRHSINEERYFSIRANAQDYLSRIKDHFSPLKVLVESFFKKSPRYQVEHDNEVPFPKSQDELSSSIVNHLKSMDYVFKLALSDIYPWYEMFGKEKDKDEGFMKAWVTFESMMVMMEHHAEVLKDLLEPRQNWCQTMHYSESNGFFFQTSPVDVGQLIYENVLKAAESVVFTSATLANAQGDMGMMSIEWMTGYYQVESQKRFKTGTFLSPQFDYAHKAKVFLATDLPPMNDPQFVVKLIDKTSPSIEILGGRTLYLFSSKYRFEMAAQLLLKKFEGKIPLFVQGMGKSVIEEFKKSPSGILIGMESFGEGIDIPGDKLQLIIIDKVPDLRMDLVIQARREFFADKFGNEFQDYFLSHRARSLHQKFGRLLRRESDIGGILLVDQRLTKWKGSTMKSFFKLLEPYQLEIESTEESMSQLVDFIKKNTP